MHKLAEMSALINKRCKNVAETMAIVSEIDKRKREIEEMGGDPPGNDSLTSIIWSAMDPSTQSHISGKMDVQEVTYADLRKAIMKHTSLVGATRQSRPTPMDLGAIEDARGEKTEGRGPMYLAICVQH